MLKRTIIAISAAFLMSASSAQVTFDPDQARAQLLGLLESASPLELEVNPPAKAGSKQQEFLSYYEKHILPVRNEFSEISIKYSVYHQLVDAGLYKTEAERAQWEKLKEEAYSRYVQYATDPAWEAVQLRLGELAQGLEGEMAQVARMDAAALVFNQFPPEVQSLIEEEQKLSTEIDNIANTSPYKMKFQENTALRSQVLSAYFDGKLGFEEASKQIEDLSVNGAYAYGGDVYAKGTSQLNRIAVIRSKLARSKGYKTHADFQIASQSVAHAEKFKSKEKLLAFLEGLLEQTQAITDRYYQAQAKAHDITEISKLRPFQLTLLGYPTYLLMRDYYQKERFDSIWRGTMLESGFPEETLNQIIVDGFPRENKNSHAYMRPMRTPEPKRLRIDGATLNPLELQKGEWLPAAIYILQNYNDDGLGDLTTAFHEGGHALDYSYQKDELGFPSAYGYTETHSTTMESFIEDQEFLMAHGRTREGEEITLERVELFIKRKGISDLLAFRSNVENAIYDIKIWDYDYENGELTFTDRAATIADEMNARYGVAPWPKDIKARPAYANFITSHFRSGSVRYFGYVLAEVSAALMSEALLDRLENETGRRSLYQQPTMAPILTEGIYREGFKPPFPESVESFAGKEFSPENFTKNLVETVTEFIDEIEQESAKKSIRQE